MSNKFIKKGKRIIKKILNIDTTIKYGSYDEKNFSKALKELTDNNPELLNTRSGVGKRKDNKPFYPAVYKIDEAFKFFRIKVHEYGDPNIPEIFEYDGLHSGTPMKTKPFKGCINEIKHITRDKTLYWYPSTVGSIKARQKFVDYLHREGFKINKSENYDGLSIDNICFTCSTTHAYSLILNLISRPEDVILVTGPNYGLFAIEPERMNAHVEVIDLKEEDHFFVNPQTLATRIDEINHELKEKWQNKLGYTPKVVAYLNMNPHNPIGNVMTKNEIDILKGIGDVCLEKGVFVIDDLIYRDLTFDQDNLAFPLASIPKYFNNTISLFGLSKAYGLASFRTGVVVAPIPVCRGLANLIFQAMDSVPVLQVKSIEGAFNGSNKRYRDTKRYFKPIIKEYKYRLELLKCLVEGINVIEDEKIKRKIIKDINKYEKRPAIRQKLLAGIPDVTIRKNTLPTSGFFAIIDFTKLKGKSYQEDTINGEFDLLKYFFKAGKVKYIMGMSMSWPYEDEIVGRVNFGLEKEALINNFRIINLAVRKLK